ncbi:MAG: MASE3 domain-containing protein [Desulfoprunum sp.]|nr:MASE3 domain-containing protein [Desulfoprunum sp.]
MADNNRFEILSNIGGIMSIALGLYLCSRYSYLLFHGLIEITTIAIGFTLFILTWNTSQYLANTFLRLLGIGYGFIALLDLLHTLSYKGMNVFPGFDANLPTQLWIAARYLQAVTLVGALLLLEHQIDDHVVFAGYAAAIVVLTAMIYSCNFPDCFIEGVGLTAFKINSEYLISALLLAMLYLFFRQRRHFSDRTFWLIAFSIASTVISELSFTAYVSVYGFANLIGHFAKLAAFYLIYRAILVTGLKDPFELIFRDLMQTEESLRQSQDTLEATVAERTAELRVSEKKFRSLIDNVQTAIVLHDGQGLFLSGNPLAQKLLGLSADQLLGKALIDPDWHFLRGDGSVMPVAEYPVSRVLAMQTPLRDYLAGISRPDRDEVIWVLVNAEPEYRETGEIAQVIVSFVDITERRWAEGERLTNMHFFESMDRVNRAIQGAGDLEQMMNDVLEAVISSFNCDRAFLMYPCDPEAATWRVPMERTRPEYPGARSLGIDMPMDADVARTLRELLAFDRPVKFGPETEHPLPEDIAQQFGFRSFMSIAIFPKVGKPWQFGVHQCSYARVWTPDEERLLSEIGRRLADGLASLLSRRDLQESEAQYRRIVNTATEGIWVLGQDHLTTFVNAQLAKMLGESTEAMIGRSLSDFMFEEDVADHLEKMENRRRGLAEHYERRLRRKDGETVWSLVSATPIFDDEHHFQGSFGMFTDITERMRAEEEIRILNQELEQRVLQRTTELEEKSVELLDSQSALINIVEDLNEKTAQLEHVNTKLKELDQLKSMFIASMSHELRTPLNSIIGFSSIMLNEWAGPLNAEQKENLAAVLRSGKHLLSLINDVIDVSKIEAGKIDSVVEDFDVHDVVIEAVETFKKDIEKKGLELIVQAPRQVFHTDRRRFLQCLLNLLSNATKFTNQGSIGVSTELSADGCMMTVAVEDTGIGIGEDDLGKLFSPFVRLHTPGESVVPGTGLGLYLTKKILRETLHGDMLVTSTYGAGSRFTMRVPTDI